MSYSVLVEEGQSCGHLPRDLCCLSLHKPLPALYVGQQVTWGGWVCVCVCVCEGGRNGEVSWLSVPVYTTNLRAFSRKRVRIGSPPQTAESTGGCSYTHTTQEDESSQNSTLPWPLTCCSCRGREFLFPSGPFPSLPACPSAQSEPE